MQGFGSSQHRTLVQVAGVASVALCLIFFLDRRYRVLPPSIHEYMPLHYPHGLVVTDITVLTCSHVNPFSTCKLDPASWERIDKDLYLDQAWFTQAWIHVRRSLEADLKADDHVVVDVAIGASNPGLADDAAASSAPNSKQQWQQRPMGLWVLRSSSPSARDSTSAVTSVDVLFGDDVAEVRPGWNMVATSLMVDRARATLPKSRLTLRRGSPHVPKKPQLRVPDSGHFKILQVADMHLSTGPGVCRDAQPNEYKGGRCLADPRTIDFMIRMLDEERPDLVVLSGDQVNGESAQDVQSAIFKYALPLIERKIPYVTIFGNHDDSPSRLSRADQMAIVETLPYSLSQPGPEDVSGVGNYYVEILARGSSDHSAITIYLLDTHSYSPDEAHYRGYDWIKQDQIDWFRKTASTLRHKHRDYSLIHMDLAFIHIPLPEYREPGQLMVGSYREPVTAPLYNSSFRDALVDQRVMMLGCGHDHVNDYCTLSVDSEQKPALWMCYAGGAGFGGYAGYGEYTRRVRVYDVDSNAARITTWKRLEWGETAARIDEQIIVEDGKAVVVLPPELQADAN